MTRIALSELLPNPVSKFPTRTSILVFLDLNILVIDITSTRPYSSLHIYRGLA